MALDLIAGTYYVGEVPEPIDITVSEDDGDAFNLTGATVSGSYNVSGGTDAALTVSTVTAASGIVRVSWGAAQFTTAGTLHATVWATFGSGVKVVLAKIVADVADPGADLT